MTCSSTVDPSKSTLLKYLGKYLLMIKDLTRGGRPGR